MQRGGSTPVEHMNIGDREVPVRYGRAPSVEIVAWILLLGVTAAAIYYWWPPVGLPSLRLPLTAQSTAPNAPEPGIHPKEGRSDAGPGYALPALDDSDPALKDTLAGLFGPRWLGRLFYRRDLARRFVVTVDNLPRRQLPSQLLLIKAPAGHFLTTSLGGGPTLIDARNAKRYTIYARFAQAVNAKKAVAAYAFFYPLFEQEYRILGYPSGSFNDRLIEAIDDLLMTPDVRATIEVMQPKVMYEFADPNLEALSAGEKILLRMGADNAAKIKAKLREIRQALQESARAL